LNVHNPYIRSKIPGYQGHIPGLYSENKFSMTYGQLIDLNDTHKQ